MKQSDNWLDMPNWFAVNKWLALETLIDLADIMQCRKGDEFCAIFRRKRGSPQQPRKATGDRWLFKQCVHYRSNIRAVSNQRQRACDRTFADSSAAVTTPIGAIPLELRPWTRNHRDVLYSHIECRPQFCTVSTKAGANISNHFLEHLLFLFLAADSGLSCPLYISATNNISCSRI
jgi:hypothetical protein